MTWWYGPGPASSSLPSGRPESNYDNPVEFRSDCSSPGNRLPVNRQLGSYQLINRAAHWRCRCFLRCPEAPVGSIASLGQASSTPTGNEHLNLKCPAPIATIILYSAS